MSIRLSELLRGIDPVEVTGPIDVEIGAVCDDSRLVTPGDLFVAQMGLRVDGHDFLVDAAARGARAAIVDRSEVAFPGTVVRVANIPIALALLAANRAGNPASRMRLTGVTGTNGKTTTTYLVEAMLSAAGRRPGVIGTVTYRHPGPQPGSRIERPAPFTTPGPLELHRTLGEILAAGCTDVVMETSSHALAQERLAGLSFAVAAFTNLTQDHLDFHGTMEAYFQAKARLFAERLEDDGIAVALIDDPAGERILALAGARCRLRCSLRDRRADVHVTEAETSLAGIAATIQTPRGCVAARSPLLGEYNLANILVATGIGEALGLPLAAIAEGIALLSGVPGRVERVPNDHGIGLVVDYAHTPDALERVMAALRPLLATGRRLLVVFGCGGDRDRTKRPKMGRIVARDSDLAIVTSDNPRTEDPLAILAMICEGVVAEPIRPVAPEAMAGARKGYCVLPDRRDAIRAAIRAAREGDIVLIAGKGHEDYQILGQTKIHFDDREEARAAVSEAW